jgi:hypothetical protein
MPVARRTAKFFDDIRAEEARRNAAMFGRRSAGSNVYPHLNSTPLGRAANPRPQGSASARLYPHLPQQSAARMQQPKPRVRMTHARRLYGSLE